MSVRAKFRVNLVSSSRIINQYISKLDGVGQAEVQDISLSPVSYQGSEENKEFYASTPGGNISLVTVNKAAAEQFIVGKEYYIDFTPAD